MDNKNNISTDAIPGILPELREEELELGNILNSKELQSMMDDLYNVTGMGIGIIDLKGNVLVGTGWQDICTKFHRVNPESLKNCLESDLILTRGIPEGEISSYKCRNNLWDMASPIYIGGRQVGNIFFGQFFYEDEEPDYELFATQAERFGFDKHEYMTALKHVARFSRDKVKSLMQFYAKFAGMISSLGYSNLMLSRLIEEKRHNEIELRKAKDDLEQKIEDRTYDLQSLNKMLMGELAERKRTEAARRESETLFHTMVDWTYDWEYWMRPDGGFVYMTPSVMETTGYYAEEFMERPSLLLDIIHPADRPLMEKHISDSVSGPDKVTHLDFRIVTRSGEERWIGHVCRLIFDDSGKYLGRRASNRNITAQKRNEAVNNSRLHLLQYAVSHTLAELLEETINEAERLTGSLVGFYHFVDADQTTLTLQEWSTRTKSEFCKSQGKGSHYPISQAGVWVECVYQGRPLIHNDYATLPNRKGLPEGHATVIRELVVPVYRNKKITAILGVGNKPADYNDSDINMVSLLADLAWEIAERKMVEESIKRLNEELERRVAERTAQLEGANRELEAFSYSVSHDLRTPLRAIHGFSQIITEDYSNILDDDGRRALSHISENARKMDELISDLLEFSRSGRREMMKSEIDMTSMARSVFDDLRQVFPARTINLTISDMPGAFGDRSMIRQVFTNLISNSMKFTRQKESAGIEIGYDEGDKAYFIRDNGVGFDMNYSNKLFGVFQRLHTSSEFEGTGVGLALVQRIIKRHGGRVWAEGKVNEGSTFYFTLPEADQK